MNMLIKKFSQINSTDVKSVGGKNSSLGEMFNQLSPKGINIPDGFATTVDAWWLFVESNHLKEKLTELMNGLDKQSFSNLREVGLQARKLVLNGTMPDELKREIIKFYQELFQNESLAEVAVRSSATAEDLPTASFAGQHDSFLNIKGEEEVLKAVQRCFASLFTDRAIKYREDNKFEHMNVALSAGVQKMVRSDQACSGICFTIEPESGFQNIILLSGVWGLGENIVQGSVTPDEYFVFKPTLKSGMKATVSKNLGSKNKTMIYADKENGQTGFTVNIDTPIQKQEQYVLNDDEVWKLANWALTIEEHYKKPMDIEWAKDGISGKFFIVQARPETVQSRRNPYKQHEYQLTEKRKVPLTKGEAIGSKIISGIAKLLQSPAESDKLQPGEILITEMTSPDWDPILKKAGAIITNKGGRTSHASIVARELGVAAIVGTGDATQNIKDGQLITVSCSEGKIGFVYDGKLEWTEREIDLQNIKLPETQVMLIVADPEKAFKLSFYPNNGVGLMRLEFIINNAIRIHPMALVKFNELKDKKVKQEIELLTHHYPDKEKYFVDKLSQAVATIACAFYPKDVIVRMSDFKTNEYANLIGGKDFEPLEENPMLGFRGASRYYSERYKEGFRLECEAMKIVRGEMGLTNVKLMIPFCRTVEEGEKVVALMEEYGLKRGEKGLEIYVMAEIPSNIILAEEFSRVFDGFSIGSNDLTQLTLGIDRDSSIIFELFNEQNPAVKKLIADVIRVAKKMNRKIGLCGQAPSDHVEFAQFLVEQNIDSISFNPDALIKGIENINAAEKLMKPVSLK
ncbi:MAG: phosphoenolpyruvate synthase [Bacteroidota bacterium]